MTTNTQKTSTSSTGRRLALVVGVNTTNSRVLSPLNHAIADAQEMETVLRDHCGFELLVPSLLGTRATSEAIRKAVRTLVRERTDDDFLVFYFSGHGCPMKVEANRYTIYLGSADFAERDIKRQEGDQTLYEETAHVSFHWLRNQLYESTQAGRVLLILDCCFAGAMGGTAPDLYLQELQQRLAYYFQEPSAESPAKSNGLRLALTATGYNRTAGDSGAQEQGLMTGWLLPALRGEISDVIEIERQGAISLQYLHRHLELVMPEIQRPGVSGTYGSRDCILASYPELAERLRRKTTSTRGTEHPTSYIPFLRDPLFQQRPSEFDRLETLLLGTRVASLPVRLGLVGVIGMGGIGKTKLAIELAYRLLEQRKFPDGIFWMLASGTTLPEWQHHLAELAFNTSYLPPDDDPSQPENEARRAQHLARYLAGHTDVLLMLDNVDDPACFTAFLPELAGRDLLCTILYTSRQTQAPVGITTYAVKQLPEKAALHLLLRTTRPALLVETLEESQSAEARAARAICQWVGYLPLGLVLLRDLLALDHSLALVHLGEELQQQGVLSLTEGLHEQGVLDIATTLTATFRLSWQRVHMEEARHVFQLAASFPAATSIPLWLLGLASGLGEESTILNTLGQARLALQKVSLLEELAGQQVRLHPLIREFGQRVIAESGAQGTALLKEAGERLISVGTDLIWLEAHARRNGYWQCLEQIRAMQAYLNLLHMGDNAQIVFIDTLERWLDKESYLLANTTWWPDKLPGLFYQQLFNRAMEAGQPLKEGRPPARWLRQMRSANAEDPALLRIFTGHTDWVRSVAFSPDGRLVLTGSHDGTARLWETASGRELRRLEGHTNLVSSVAFSLDGHFVLTGSFDDTARLWETASGCELTRLQGHTYRVLSVAFSPDGRLALTGSEDRTARLWEAATGRELGRLKVRTSLVNRVAFSPDGSLVLIGLYDGTVRLWQVARGHKLTHLRGHTGAVYSMAFSPDGRLVLTGSQDGTARLWEIASGRELRRLEGGTGAVHSVAFSPDGRFVLTGSEEGTVCLWEIASGRELRRLEGHASVVLGVAFSPDGRLALTGSGDDTARLWETASGRERPRLQGHTALVSSVAFSPDGHFVLTGSEDGTARLWETTNGREFTLLLGHTRSVESVAFSPDGHFVLTGSQDGTARLWETASGRELRRLKDHTNSVISVAFSPDGSLVLTGSYDGTTRLSETATGREFMLLGHTLPVNNEGFRTDVRLVFQHAVTSVAFSPDGSLVIIGKADGTARLWETASGRELTLLQGHTNSVKSVAFSPDGRLVLIGSYDGTAYLWETATGRELGRLKGYTNAVTNVAFSPDGHLAITCDQSGRVFFWRVFQPEDTRLFGLYVTPYEVGDLYWEDATHLLLADMGGPRGRPHYYYLALEGM